MRGTKRRQVDDGVELEDLAAFTHSLETRRLVANEMWQKIEVRLDSLPPTQRLVFELRAFHDLSFDEISISPIVRKLRRGRITSMPLSVCAPSSAAGRRDRPTSAKESARKKKHPSIC